MNKTGQKSRRKHKIIGAGNNDANTSSDSGGVESRVHRCSQMLVFSTKRS
jgi:hypothetical protein